MIRKLIIVGLLLSYVSAFGQRTNDKALETMLLDTSKLTSTPLISFNRKGINEGIQNLKSLAYSTHVSDSTRMLAFLHVAKFYIDINNDSSRVYARESKKLAQQLKLVHFEAQTNDFLGCLYPKMGNSAEGLDLLLKAKKTFLEVADSTFLIVVNRNLGSLYKTQSEYDRAKKFFFEALTITPKSASDSIFRSWALMDLGELYLQINEIDSAFLYTKASNDITYRLSQFYSKKYLPIAHNNLGKILEKKGDFLGALAQYRSGLQVASINFNDQAVGDIFLSMSGLYKHFNKPDSAFLYAKKSFQIAINVNNPSLIEKSSAYLKDFFKAQNKIDSAFYYQEIMLNAINTNRNADKIKQIQNLAFRELFKEQELKTERTNFRNQIILYSLSAILGILLLAGFFLYKSNKQKQKANAVLEKTLSALQSTQAQLIQKEKLASLGELTAGIAHEIQNPLNFVNNFSEMSVELISELKEERSKEHGKRDEELENELLNDLAQNQQKINHHGKRASSIVSGMLEHSKASTGEPAFTDINKLTDEYLRLSYHGIRAKDSNFNSDYKTDFDENLPKIKVISQDMGRVLLNLINNAFWAVKTVEKPLVTVKTEHTENQLIIKVIDNGTGMTDDVKAKIFQPFFTTKPTGQGTGLGLSLAYDIVTKGHGGTIEVQSKQGEGSEFIITLPMTTN